MNTVKINLTYDQVADLSPIFSQLNDIVNDGGFGAILAQVYPDGMIVRVVSSDTFLTLQKTLGGDPNGDRKSVG